MSAIRDHYLSAGFLSGEDLEFEWDNWNYVDHILVENEELVDQFAKFSYLANRGYCLAASELIALRFGRVEAVSEALEFIDAAWLTMLDSNACDYGVFSRHDWQGLVRGPLRAALLIVNDTIFDAMLDEQLALRSCWITHLAWHIFTVSQFQKFESWRFEVLKRLETEHPKQAVEQQNLFDEDDYVESPTAPITFIVDLDYSADQAEPYLVSYRKNFADNNPWLRWERFSEPIG